MIRRGVLLLTYAFLGLMLSYAALYLFTPFGLAIVAICAGVWWMLPAVGESRLPEAIGLVAGPGLFCLMVAANADEPAAWRAAGAALVGTAVIAYAMVGRARCARSA